MGVMDKFLTYMKLSEDDENYYDDDDFDEEDPVEIQRKPGKDTSEVTEERKKSTPKVTQIQPRMIRRNTGAGMEVCVIKPTSVEDAREITDTLLANRTVVLNLEGIDVEIAQRVIDFTSGSTYAIHGNLQKISHYIFIITPASVDISGDFQEILSGTFDVPINNNRF
ncbi:MAG: cell division protein SepF [Lachnospiraceae bacterium]|nr:cell division protein SepF [Lachnospiraceae bacterium]